jgi:hypothetical protein
VVDVHDVLRPNTTKIGVLAQRVRGLLKLNGEIQRYRKGAAGSTSTQNIDH